MLMTPFPRPEARYPHRIVIVEKRKVRLMIRRAGMPMASISSPAENRDRSGPGMTRKITVAARAKAMPVLVRIFFRDRILSALPAPRLKPAIGMAACPRPFMGIIRKFWSL